MPDKIRAKRWIVRILRTTMFAILGLILLTVALIQFQQRLLRYRAEQLLADFHQIRLHQSTWEDAQKLMQRWGAWGHYEGQCTSTVCRYTIVIENSQLQLQQNIVSFDESLRIGKVYTWFGGRFARMRVAFIVQDGTIWRTDISMLVNVPPQGRNDASGYGLGVVSKSQQALRQSEGGGWVLGNDDELAQHPYYKASRPGGCEFCMVAEVTYSTHTPQAEIKRLTDFDLSCITRFRPCLQPRDLLPAAREWHLYDFLDPGYQDPVYTPLPDTCDIPLWAVARDADAAISVDVLSATQVHEHNTEQRIAKVSVREYLKGEEVLSKDKVLSIYPFASDSLIPGQHYLVLLTGEHYGTLPPFPKEWDLRLGRCDTQPDTPQVRAELENGFAQNDTLRGPELR
jgi:hypothetical protein